MGFEINVVLARTLYPSNIGSTARAMANMGAHRLILIAPQCEPNASRAKMAAAGAQELLEKIVIYETWKDFYAVEGGGFRIALTRRPGRYRELNLLPNSMRQLIAEQSELINQPWYFVFGPEDNGLDNNDLAFVNICAELPTYGSFGSLNLSHAVLLTLSLAQQIFQASEFKNTIENQPALERRPLAFSDEILREWIEAIGFDIEARRASAYLTVRKLLLQKNPSDQDLHVLQAVLQQTVRKLR